MTELGKRNDCLGLNDPTMFRPLTPNEVEYGRPNQMPRIPEGWSVIAGYDQGLGERMILCTTLADMQDLYDAYDDGGALRLKWYAGFDVGFVTAFPATKGAL